MSLPIVPERKFIGALHDIVGDNAGRLSPFAEVAQQAQMNDGEAHGAFAELNKQGLVRSNAAGCVGLTDAGRTFIRSPRAARKAVN